MWKKDFIRLKCKDLLWICTCSIQIVFRIRDDLVHLNYYSTSDEEPIFTFIKAYGFRNLRDILRKLKKQLVGKNVYFIEIMACPSGIFFRCVGQTCSEGELFFAIRGELT